MERVLEVHKDRLSYLQHAEFDLVVIGGGINGASIARDAALRGLKVILLEKTDFGAGASTQTSKLAHGGLRYLEQFDFGLVKESLYERNCLLKNAPHLVSPLKFIFPIYAHSSRPLWQVHLGLYLYDFFARGSGLPRHMKLSKAQVEEAFPDIQKKDLIGGCAYYDAQMKDNRLLMENILAAEQAGAIVLNYAMVVDFSWLQGKIEKVHFKDQLTDSNISIKCKLVANTTGAWSNSITNLESNVVHPRVAPSKGVHIVIPKMFANALILRAPMDGRVFFVLPWEEYSLIGTTDTYFDDEPEKVAASQSDIAYLLEAFSHHFPHSGINETSIISTFAGLRPLVETDHHTVTASSVSREHVIQLSQGGMLTVLGGKYTTYRHVAEEAVDIIIKNLFFSKKLTACRTVQLPLPGAYSIEDQAVLANALQGVGLSKMQIEHLMQNYGKLAWQILEIIKNDAAQMQQMCSEHPHIFAELTYILKHEHAKRLADWYCRRSSIAYSACHGMLCSEKISYKFAAHFGWSETQRVQELDAFLHYAQDNSKILILAASKLQE